jgi:hypothetical protein
MNGGDAVLQFVNYTLINVISLLNDERVYY